jgi:voltage-gated potassium channel
MTPVLPTWTRKERRRFLLVTALKAAVATVGVLLVYYLIPLDRVPDGRLFIVLVTEMLLLATVIWWQVRRVFNSRTPLLAAIEALAITIPLFLVIFAAMYVVLANDSGSNFNVGSLTRTDALYFTVTVFATVGFGDITATSQLARVLVTVQMLVDLVVLGVVIRVFFGAVQEAWKIKADVDPTAVRDAVARRVEDSSTRPVVADGVVDTGPGGDDTA